MGMVYWLKFLAFAMYRRHAYHLPFKDFRIHKFDLNLRLDIINFSVIRIFNPRSSSKSVF